MEYQIEYFCRNVYGDEVREAVFDFRILPCTDEKQSLISWKLTNSLGEALFLYKDTRGFDVQRLRSTHIKGEFELRLLASVRKNTEVTFAEEPWSLYSHESFMIQHPEYLFNTPYTAVPQSIIDQVPLKEEGEDAFLYFQRLNSYVYSLLTYEKYVTSVQTTAEDALVLGKGVCQDFTHVFCGLARKIKLPARYVSGYLHQSGEFNGTGQMHAWVEVLLPGKGWIGLDPSNDCLADEHYIKVGHGADYLDCTPLRGVLKTNGTNQTSHQVFITSQQ